MLQTPLNVHFHFLTELLVVFFSFAQLHSAGYTLNMYEFDNDGLQAKEDWKSEYEALLKKNMDMEKKSKSLMDQLGDRVRCPICLEVPTSSPMYSCANGHLVCAACYQGSLSNCSVCRTRMHKTVPLLATTVIENIEHSCKFETDGCKVKTSVTDIERHRKSCSFRPVDCPSHLCKKKVPFGHVVDHVMVECDYSFSKGRGSLRAVEYSSINSTFNFPANMLASATYSVEMYQWNGQFFFLNMRVESALHRKFYVQMFGTEEECKKYTVQINLGDKTGKYAITFCDHPFPIEVSEEDLKAGGLQVSHVMQKKVCIPVVDKLNFSLLLTFARVTLKD